MKFIRVLLLGLLVSIASCASAFASDFTSEVGVWRLSSLVFVEDGTGQRINRFGEHPEGILIFSPDGYMSVVINAQGRAPLSGDPVRRVSEQAALYSSMTAHAGKYTLTNGHLVNQVEVAHNPNMVGKDLLRTVRFVSPDVIESTTPPVTTPDGKKGISFITWRRVK